VAIYPIANTANVPERWDIALDGHGFRMEEGTYRQVQASPFAERIGTGDREYSDNRIWSTWAQRSWHRGATTASGAPGHSGPGIGVGARR
jgi:hypothetical protein